MNPESSASSIGRRAPMAASQSGNFEARPVASMMRSAETSSPSLVRTPVTCGIPFRAEGPVSRLATDNETIPRQAVEELPELRLGIKPSNISLVRQASHLPLASIRNHVYHKNYHTVSRT